MSETREEFIKRFRAMSPEEKLDHVRECHVTDRSKLPAEAREFFEKAHALMDARHDSIDHPPLRIVDHRIPKAI